MKRKMNAWMDILSYLDISEKILEYSKDRTLRAALFENINKVAFLFLLKYFSQLSAKNIIVNVIDMA